MGSGALTGFLVVGMIMVLSGFIGLAFTDPFSDPIGWFVLIGLGFALVFGGILFVTVKVGTAKQY